MANLPHDLRHHRSLSAVTVECRGDHRETQLLKSLNGLRFTLVGVVLLAVAFASGARASEDHFRVEKRHITIDVAADGTSVMQWYEVTLLLTDRGIDWNGEDWTYFTDVTETVEVLEAFTELPDGTKVEVDDNAIRLVEGDSTAQAGSFTDSKAYVVIFPQLVQGARTHVRTRSTTHLALFDGEYFETFSFSPSVHFGEVVLDLSHDPQIKLAIEVSDIEGSPVVERLADGADGSVRYQIRFSQTQRQRIEAGAVEGLDRNHYVRISSLPDMLAMGELYQRHAQDKELVTPEVQALADQITAGIDDPYEQARALYEWVAREIRYVAIFLGDGGVVPNYANDIIRNRYGDCKDSNTLLIALLAAKGIEAETALINSGDAYTLPKLGAVSPFNHVITYLPQWDLYTDPTDPYAPFGLLAYDTSDKPTVLTKSLQYGRTPNVEAANNRVEVTIDLAIADDGSIQGLTQAHLKGPTSRSTRASLLNYMGMYKDDMARQELASYGLIGEGRFEFEAMNDLSNPVAYTANFRIQPVTNFPGPGALQVPVGLAPGRIARFAAHPPEPAHQMPFTCLSYSADERYTISFPDSVNVTRLPPERMFVSGGYMYRSSYRVSDSDEREVRVHREMVLQTPSQVCKPGDEATINELLAVIQADLRGQIFYEPKP